MARAQATDFLQGFRFHVEVMESKGDNPLLFSTETGVQSLAGFQSVTLPELTAEAVEYREGTYKYTKKFSGVPTVGDATLMRGVSKKDTAFFDWVVAAISGAEYRCDIKIMQFGRENMPTADAGEYAKVHATAARIYKCYQCVPTRVKPTADFDATSSEISMAEVDFALEYFTIDVG